MRTLGYIAEVLICSGLFLVLYRWMLAKKVSFKLCRIYLIMTMVLSVTIPLMEIPLYPSETYAEFNEWTVLGSNAPAINPADEKIEAAAGQNAVTNDTYMTEVADGKPAGTLNLKLILTIPYSLVGLISLVLIAFNAIKIYRLRRKSHLTYDEEYTLAEHEDIKTPFSFIRTIFMGFNYEPQERRQILAHEASHIRHRHSYERLFMSVLRSIFWFNPFFWMAEKDLEEVQEWEADKDVLDEGWNLKTYRTTIFKQLFGYNPDITCGLNHSLTKQRFIMMTQSHRGKGAWLRLAATLPAIAATFFAFGCVTKQAKTPDEATSDLTNGTEATYIDMCPPCDAAVSNTFIAGKAERSHSGIDYVLNEGAPVYAAADGEIIAVTRNNGNGLMLTLKHTDGIETRYAHLSKVSIVSHMKMESSSTPDNKVRSVYNFETDSDHSGWTMSVKVYKGQLIGYAGSTGRATGPHLHFEVRKNGEPVNPSQYFTSDRPAKGPYRVYVVEGTTKPGEEYFAICEGKTCKINDEISQAVRKDFASKVSSYSSIMIEADADVPATVTDKVKEQLKKASVFKVNYNSPAGEITVPSDMQERAVGILRGAEANAIHINIQKARTSEDRLSDDYQMTIDGQSCTKEEVWNIIAGKIASDNSIGLIRLSAAPQTPMGYIDDLKKELSTLGRLRIHFTLGNTITPNYPAPEMKKDELRSVKTYKTDRKNIIVIRTNAADRYLIISEPGYLDETSLKRLKKSIMNKEGAPDLPDRIEQEFIFPDGSAFTFPVTQAIIVMQHDRGTSFEGYQNVNAFVQRAYMEMRDELARKVLGKPLTALSDAEKQVICRAVPMNISEVEP